MIFWIEDSAQKNYQLGKDCVDLSQINKSKLNQNDSNLGHDMNEQKLGILKQILDLTLQMDGLLLNHCNRSINLQLIIKNIAFKHPSFN